MLTTVLPVWGVAFLLTFSCWSIGSRLVASKSPLVALLCGWCIFLLLCCVPWIVGFSAHWARPLFWAFFITGLVLAYRNRCWSDLACALVVTGGITFMLAFPFIHTPGLLAYGAHGLDMWGYVITAEWLQHHSIRELPIVGVSPMRFNWPWYVLTIRDRPLNYESLACIASATGLTVAKAYVVYPIALLSSLALGLAREARMFRFKSWLLAVVPAVAVAFHPLIVQPWIAGFFGGSIVAGFAAIAFAGAAAAEDGAPRIEALALAMLMMAFAGGLYTEKFLIVGLVLGGVPLLLSLLILKLRFELPVVVLTLGLDFSPLRSPRRTRLLGYTLAVTGVIALAVLLLGVDQPINTGDVQSPRTALGHFLGIFGGSSPYVWLGYDHSRAFDRNFFSNPVGAAACVIMFLLFAVISWQRWKASRDLVLPLLVGVCVGLVGKAYADEVIMAKTLAIFGFTLVIMLAAVSTQLRHWTLGLLAAAVCCMPSVRSAAQMQEVIHDPYIMFNERDEISSIIDGYDWRFLAYLHYREDEVKIYWPKYPKTYSSVTHFLPEPMQKRLAEKYHMPNN